MESKKPFSFKKIIKSLCLPVHLLLERNWLVCVTDSLIAKF